MRFSPPPNLTENEQDIWNSKDLNRGELQPYQARGLFKTISGLRARIESSTPPEKKENMGLF